MPVEVMLVKGQDGRLHPASAADQETMSEFPIGQGVRCSIVRMKPRSMQHHRLYWGGLIELAFDYWQPSGGVLAASEIATLKRFADWLDNKSANSGAVRRACRAFLAELKGSRSQRFEAPEKSREALHEWIKMEAGYFRYETTPSGLRKVPLSISFNAMDQSEFNAFYKAAFSVVWKFILSRTFESEEQAENVINQLIAMG